MDAREVAGVRRAITWLHQRAHNMHDPHAQQVLNSAAFDLGLDLKSAKGRSECTERLDENGKCKSCGWNSRTRSYDPV